MVIVCYASKNLGLQKSWSPVLRLVVSKNQYPIRVAECTRPKTYLFTMQKRNAPSNSKPSRSLKKMKPTKVVVIEPPKGETDSKPVKVLPESVAPPPINAKQQKALHFLIAAASYNSVLERKSEDMRYSVTLLFFVLPYGLT